MSSLEQLWLNLPASGQDILLLLACLLPAALLLAGLTWGFQPWRLVRSLLRRYWWSNAVFVLLIAVSLALGIAVQTQERALRQGSAAAADRFDVLVGPPGSEVELMLSVVHLQQPGLSLLSGDVFERVFLDEQVALAAPLAFGDSIQSYPLIGTTVELAQHLTPLSEGRLFSRSGELLLGSGVSIPMSAELSPAHGHGALADVDAHQQHRWTVVGRLSSTGTVWDQAVLAPIESVWEAHGLGRGHIDQSTIGPPFDAEQMPGVNAIVVSADSMAANYAIRSRHTNSESQAIFPGEVLFRLHGLMGNVRELLSSMALLTQALIVLSVGASLMILLRLFSRRFAMLRALGAPPRFLLAVVCHYSACIVILGATLGILFGWILALAVSVFLSNRVQFSMQPTLQLLDLHLVAAFISLCLLLALIPGLLILRRSIVGDLPA